MQINLASGQRPFLKPWVNIDIRDQGYPVDIIADIKSLPMIEDNSCDVLVAHHCLEHLDMSEVCSTAKEWNRILKPGGKLAVFVPDMKALVDAWQSKRIDDYIFNVNVYGAYQGHLEDLHRWSYSYDYLVKQMSQEGNLWANTRKLEPGNLGSEYLGADLSFDWWILAVEFTK